MWPSPGDYMMPVYNSEDAISSLKSTVNSGKCTHVHSCAHMHMYVNTHTNKNKSFLKCFLIQIYMIIASKICFVEEGCNTHTHTSVTLMLPISVVWSGNLWYVWKVSCVGQCFAGADTWSRCCAMKCSWTPNGHQGANSYVITLGSIISLSLGPLPSMTQQDGKAEPFA